MLKPETFVVLGEASESDEDEVGSKAIYLNNLF